MFTPTSWYWNCVFTSELTIAVAAPVWYDPVATGILSPIFIEASCPSEARTRGFWRILVWLSLSRRLAVACPIVTAKLVPFRCAKSLIVSPLLVLVFVVPFVVVPVPVVEPVVELVVFWLLKFDDWKATVAVCGN